MEGRGQVFEEYPYADPAIRNFYERFTRGEKLKPGWVAPTDFEVEPLDSLASRITGWPDSLRGLSRVR